MNAIQTTHNLDFETAPWRNQQYTAFRVGTCEGLYCGNPNELAILAITNNEPGNGHFEDVIQWFEYSCNQHNLSFMFLEVWNTRLRRHLIEKRGFVDVQGTEHVIKHFKQLNGEQR